MTRTGLMDRLTDGSKTFYPPQLRCVGIIKIWKEKYGLAGKNLLWHSKRQKNHLKYKFLNEVPNHDKRTSLIKLRMEMGNLSKRQQPIEQQDTNRFAIQQRNCRTRRRPYAGPKQIYILVQWWILIMFHDLYLRNTCKSTAWKRIYWR